MQKAQDLNSLDSTKTSVEIQSLWNTVQRCPDAHMALQSQTASAELRMKTQLANCL